jgi:hypothetical protein
MTPTAIWSERLIGQERGRNGSGKAICGIGGQQLGLDVGTVLSSRRFCREKEHTGVEPERERRENEG